MAQVLAVSKNAEHSFSKLNCDSIELLAGIGVKGDAHAGKTVKHRSRIRLFGSTPNLRQVHLIHQELFDELGEKGFDVKPGQIGENITTTGIALLNLPEGTILKIGEEAQVKVTGLRNPCSQLNDFQPGLMQAVLGKSPDGKLIRKSGIMCIVLAGGVVKPSDKITIEWPPKPHRVLDKV